MPDARALQLSREPLLPVFVVSGFLGSGKTTLLRRALGDIRLADSAVIVNEFGHASIDHLLLEHSEDLVETLAGGCLCCIPRARLVASMFKLLHQSYVDPSRAFARLVIETSGMSDPLPLLAAFDADPLRLSRFKLGGTITTLDVSSVCPDFMRGGTARNQIEAADAIVLTKTDLADDESIEAIVGLVRSVSDAPIYDAAGPRFIEFLVNTAPLAAHAASAPLRESHALHSAAYIDLRLDLPGTMSKQEFRAWLEDFSRTLGAGLLRLKGLVLLREFDEPVEVQVAAGRISPFAPLAGRSRAEARLVAILQCGKREVATELFRRLLVFSGQPGADKCDGIITEKS